MEPLKLSWRSGSPEATHAMGVALGRLLEPGDFVGLVGELGAGKTALVRGVAAGAGVPGEDVTSPSFALINLYVGRLPIYHADLYRLGSADELYATGYDDLLQSPGAFVVEWVERISTAAPPDRIRVCLSGEVGNVRDFDVDASGPRSTARLEAWARAIGAWK